jgi:hypothetical protein
MLTSVLNAQGLESLYDQHRNGVKILISRLAQIIISFYLTTTLPSDGS